MVKKRSKWKWNNPNKNLQSGIKKITNGQIQLPFNSNEYSTAHPTLSPDEKTYISPPDMPGTLGQSDLFKVAIIEKKILENQLI
jgi:hypothetical protein